jgi:hypothetical protein
MRPQRQAALFLGLDGQLNRPRHVGLADDEALFLQSLQMAHHAVGRADLKLIANLSHGGPVAPIANLVSNELVNILLAVGQLVEQRHGVATAGWLGISPTWS